MFGISATLILEKVEQRRLKLVTIPLTGRHCKRSSIHRSRKYHGLNTVRMQVTSYREILVLRGLRCHSYIDLVEIKLAFDICSGTTYTSFNVPTFFLAVR